MYVFDCDARACPPGAEPGDRLTIAGVDCRPLAIPSQEQGASWSVTFEETLAALEALPRMFAEPDGSFVWVGEDPALGRWQVDGNLYDRAGRLLYVELRGQAPAAEFDRLLSAWGWPACPAMFAWRSAGVYLSESDFRRIASAADSG